MVFVEWKCKEKYTTLHLHATSQWLGQLENSIWVSGTVVGLLQLQKSNFCTCFPTKNMAYI